MQDAITKEEIKVTKRGLGKGLSAFLSADEDDNGKVNNAENSQPYEIALNLLKPGSTQPREHFEDGSLQELAESIKQNGVLQPILVRKIKDSDLYEIIAGERRYKAAKIAGLQKIPAIVKDIDDKKALELALIENIQRENLTPIEEADGYKRLQTEFSYTQEQLGDVLGKSRSHVANMLRLLGLPQAVKDMINAGQLSMSHARILVSASDPLVLAQKIIAENINVREAEKLAAGSGFIGGGTKSRKITPRAVRSGKPIQKDEDLLALEHSLSESLGLKVFIEDSSDGGRVILHFNNLTELDKILKAIG